jgi:hypothetical protein
MSAPPSIQLAEVTWRVPEDGEMTPLSKGFWRNPKTGMGIPFPPPPTGPLKRQVACNTLAKPVPGWDKIHEIMESTIMTQAEINTAIDKVISEAEKKNN